MAATSPASRHPPERVAMDVDPDGASSDDESAPDVAPELMVVSRARRSNAGNRMSTLIAKSAEEEEWGEEWEEAPNEEEFVGDDENEVEDYNLESSSSEEDENEAADDDTGEKELRRAERQDRLKKRKTATNPFTARLAAAARKRVKLDVPTSDALSGSAPRPKKKSERASWIPTPEDGPTRTSSRKQTVANKQHTMAKLKEKDRRRDDTLAMMKAAEARKAKDEPKVLTQAERLAEAARVERANSKSLHRWEEAEEQRAAERQAKLDALKNRQIDGPFIRFWSGPSIWVDDKLKYTGKDAPKVEDLDEKLNKDFYAGTVEQPAASAPNPINGNSSAPDQTIPLIIPPAPTSQMQAVEEQTEVGQTGAPQAQTPQDIPLPQPNPHGPPIQDHSITPPGPQHSSNIMFPPPPDTFGFLSGIEQYATQHQAVPQPDNPPQPPEPSIPQTNPQPQPQPTQPTHTHQNGIQVPPPQPTDHSPIPPNPYSPAHQPSSFPHSFPQPHPSLSDPSLLHNPPNPQTLLQQFQRPPPPPLPPRRKTIRKALRNLLILSQIPNLDPNSASNTSSGTLATTPTTTTTTRPRTSNLLKEKDRTTLIALTSTLFAWPIPEATTYVSAMLSAPKTKREKKDKDKDGESEKQKEVCAITNEPAKFRDPATGIAYRDLKAYKVLRGVVGARYVWCKGLGCYVGARMDATGVGGGGAGGGSMRGREGEGVRPVRGVPGRFFGMGAEVLKTGAGNTNANGSPATSGGNGGGGGAEGVVKAEHSGVPAL